MTPKYTITGIWGDAERDVYGMDFWIHYGTITRTAGRWTYEGSTTTYSTMHRAARALVRQRSAEWLQEMGIEP